jgi:hypothetical protein
MSNTNERETMTTIEIIKRHTDNPTWNVVCSCKSCAPKGFLKVSIEDMAKAVDENGIDFTDYRQLRKLNHKLIQQSA